MSLGSSSLQPTMGHPQRPKFSHIMEHKHRSDIILITVPGPKVSLLCVLYIFCVYGRLTVSCDSDFPGEHLGQRVLAVPSSPGLPGSIGGAGTGHNLFPLIPCFSLTSELKMSSLSDQLQIHSEGSRGQGLTFFKGLPCPVMSL